MDKQPPAPRIEEPVKSPAPCEPASDEAGQLAFEFVPAEATTPAGDQEGTLEEASSRPSRPRRPRPAPTGPKESKRERRDVIAPETPAAADRSGTGTSASGVLPAASLVSAFDVDFAMPPGSNQVILDDSGKVVEGHLQRFAADGGEVATVTRTYTDATKHEAAGVELRRNRAVAGRDPNCSDITRGWGSRSVNRRPLWRGKQTFPAH